MTMEATRRDFLAGMMAATITTGAATAMAKEGSASADSDGEHAAASASADGYGVYTTASGLQVTIADDEDPALPTVVVLATGGTIAGTGAAGKTTGYQAGQLDVGTLVRSASGIDEIANVRCVQVCNVGSDDITDEYWLKMVSAINELAQDDAVSGFVITHGTDTLEETAYFMNLTVKTDKPVVMTGAMRPSTATSADGPMNLYQAIALAANPEAAGRGSMVVFSDGIFGGRDVQKVNTFKTDAFGSKDFGCLGYMHDDKAFFANATTKRHTTQTEFDVSGLQSLPPVAVAYFHIDASPDVLDFFVESGARGIVIAGAGAGAYSGLWGDRIKALADSGVPFVDCSRIANGRVENDSDGDNVVGGGSIPPQKAVVLLRLALTVTDDVEKIQEMFDTY